MKLNKPNLLITTFYTLSFIHGRTFVASNSWSDNLATILKQDTKMNQLLLLYENDLNNNDIYQFGKNISRIIPTRLCDFKIIIERNSEELKLPPHIMQATKVVIIPSRNDYRKSLKLFNLFDSVARISQTKTLPKVLIALQSTKSKRYQEFFQSLWTLQFLDGTIVELKQSKESGITLAKNFKLHVADFQYYNPFNKRFVKTPFSKNSSLFPDKLRNLNDYKMNVTMFHYPPYVYIDRNSSGHVLDVHGPDINIMKQLSNTMNFSVKEIIFNVTNFPKINCTKEYNHDIIRKRIYNEIQFDAVQSAIFQSCTNEFMEYCRGSRVINYIVLIPILPREDRVLTTGWSLSNTIIILCLFLTPWLLSRILKFDRRHWSLMYTIQIIVGSSTPQMPRKTLERTVLLIMIGFYFLQSSYIFTTFSNLQLQKESFRKMKTIEDIVAANLTAIVPPNHPVSNKDYYTNAYGKMLKNAIVSKASFEECARTLMKHRNVTCLGREQMALLMIHKYRKMQERSRMKILKEMLGVKTSRIHLADRSPYKNRFERIINALVESGISSKWDAAYIPKEDFSQSQVELFEQESSVSSKVLILMVILLLVGYSCSFSVFAAEIFIHKYLHS